MQGTVPSVERLKSHYGQAAWSAAAAGTDHDAAAGFQAAAGKRVLGASDDGAQEHHRLQGRREK